jgi:cytochrome c oxidase subunit III
MEGRFKIDLEHLDTAGFGSRSPITWGTYTFILLETTGFAMAVGSYFYLQSRNSEWPLGAVAPGLWPGSIITLIMLASVVPNHFIKGFARDKRVTAVRLGLLLMSATGVVLLGLRALEFFELNVRWDSNAYGSIVWLILGLHTAHLLTDVADTLVLTALMFTRHGKKKRRLADVEDNGVYWDFVVWSWLPIYAVIYWVPRW